jgi:hypothetical protein
MKRFISSFINIWVRKWKACVQFEQVCATSAQAGTRKCKAWCQNFEGERICIPYGFISHIFLMGLFLIWAVDALKLCVCPFGDRLQICFYVELNDLKTKPRNSHSSDV